MALLNDYDVDKPSFNSDIIIWCFNPYLRKTNIFQTDKLIFNQNFCIHTHKAIYQNWKNKFDIFMIT